MEVISRGTLELILKTFESASTDETRVNLNGVRIANKDKGTIVEATDGHILTRHFLVQDNFELKEDVIIDKIGKAKLKSFLNSNKHDMKFNIDFDVETNRNLRVYTTDNRDGIVLPVIFREYPKTDAVIPVIKNEDDYLEVSLNPVLLSKLYKSMNGNKRGERVTLKIKKDNEFAPILVESGNNNLGVIMPMRK